MGPFAGMSRSIVAQARASPRAWMAAKFRRRRMVSFDGVDLKTVHEKYEHRREQLRGLDYPISGG
jgi:hypothetical protein